MKHLLNYIGLTFGTIGAFIGSLLGGFDGMVLTLIGFVAADYITGLACAWVEKKINSEVGLKGIVKKVLIFVFVGLAAALDQNYLNGQLVIRAAVISFFVANEGISLIENAGRLGLPVPEPLKNALEQLKGGKQ